MKPAPAFQMRRALMAAALAAGLACGGDDPVSPIDRRGHYILTSVNGQSLPVVVDIPTDNPDITISRITSGSINLGTDGTQTMLLGILVDTPNGIANGSVTFGTTDYALSANSLEVSFTDRPFVGTFGSGREGALTIPVEPWGTLQFTRR